MVGLIRFVSLQNILGASIFKVDRVIKMGDMYFVQQLVILTVKQTYEFQK
jgi:hypothetical protein